MTGIEQPVGENAHVFGLGQRLGFDQQAMAVAQIVAPGVVPVLMGARLQQRARRAQAVVHVTEQGILEFGVTTETEFFTSRTMVGSLTPACSARRAIGPRPLRGY